jgi:hypothetical protein
VGSLVRIVAHKAELSLDVKLNTFERINQMVDLGHVFFRLSQQGFKSGSKMVVVWPQGWNIGCHQAKHGFERSFLRAALRDSQGSLGPVGLSESGSNLSSNILLSFQILKAFKALCSTSLKLVKGMPVETWTTALANSATTRQYNTTAINNWCAWSQLEKEKRLKIRCPERVENGRFLTTTTDLDLSPADEVSAKPRASCQRGLTDGLCWALERQIKLHCNDIDDF